MFYGALVDNPISRNLWVNYKSIKYQSTVTSTVKYRVTLQSQVTVTETRYYFGQVLSTVPSYKKRYRVAPLVWCEPPRMFYPILVHQQSNKWNPKKPAKLRGGPRNGTTGRIPPAPRDSVAKQADQRWRASSTAPPQSRHKFEPPQ